MATLVKVYDNVQAWRMGNGVVLNDVIDISMREDGITKIRHRDSANRIRIVRIPKRAYWLEEITDETDNQAS